MNIYSIPPLVTSLTALVLGIVALTNNHRSRINFSFFLLCLTTFWWQFAWFVLFNNSDPTWALWLCKVGYTGIIFIPISYYYFVTTFISAKDRWFVSISYAVGALLVGLLWTTDWFVHGYFNYSWGYYPKVGVLHVAHLLQLSVIALRMIYLLVKQMLKVKSTSPIEYNQIKYVALSVFIYLPAATDYIVNYGLGFYPPGFIFVIMTLALFSYAIIRYQFMDINIAITKGLTFTTFLIVSSIAVYLTMLAYEKIFLRTVDLGVLVPHALIAVAVISLVIFLLPRISFPTQERIKTLLFKNRYDYQKVIMEALKNRNILNIRELKRLWRYLLGMVWDAFRVEKAGVYVFDDGKEQFRLDAYLGLQEAKAQQMELGREHAIVRLLESERRPILSKELSSLLSPDEHSALLNKLHPLLPELFIPIFKTNSLFGFMVFENKATGDIYSQEDMDLIDIMISQMNVVVENIELNREMVEKQRYIGLGMASMRMAHDIKNPLTSIRTYLQMLPRQLEKLAPEPDSRHTKYFGEYYETVCGDLNRINSLVQRVLHFSNQPKPNLTSESLPAVLDEALLGLKLILDEKQVRVTKDYDPQVTTVMIDKEQLMECLENLIGNACDAMVDQPAKQLTLATHFNQDHVSIEIQDTGCGIPKEHQDKIFDPFITLKHNGTGLGLAIVKEIVKNHQGIVSFESQEGRGTTFYLKFPLNLKA